MRKAGFKASEETKKKMSVAQKKRHANKIRVKVDCIQCGSAFLIIPSRKGVIKNCSRKCRVLSYQQRKPWNLGMKGFLKGQKRPKMSAHAGENHWSYIKDRSKLAKANEHRNDSTYKDWSFSIKRRDSWKCQIADSNCSGRMESHHILSYKEFPELRYDMSNGITLCHYHHPRGRVAERNLAPLLQEKVLLK